jgi:hypothetical protein
MVKAPTEGIKNSKPRFKSAREELPQLSREYLIHRNEQMRNQNLTAQVELAVRRGQLISKDLAVKQASFLMIALRQRLLNLSSHTHKLVGLDAKAMRKALREIAISTLKEIKNLPSAVTDQNWLNKLEAEEGKS